MRQRHCFLFMLFSNTAATMEASKERARNSARQSEREEADHLSTDDSEFPCACCRRRRQRYQSIHDNEQRCLSEASKYQRHFPEAPPLSSKDFLLQCREYPYVLVDARTLPEQRVSMIRGALNLTEFRHRMEKSSTTLNSETTVIVYCTVGYRSGMEVTRLKQLYPQLNVQSLDGIVAYTHALAKETTREVPVLVDSHGEPTQRVHTFASSWDMASEHCETQQFRSFALLGRLLQVGVMTAVRSIQSLLAAKASRNLSKRD